LAEIVYSPAREKARHRKRLAAQARLHRRNRGLGLVMVAIAILLWRLLHTHSGWLFPQGWWRP
jgi:hypothetical protein